MSCDLKASSAKSWRHCYKTFFLSLSLKPCLMLAKVSGIMPATMTRDSDTLVLALATLSGATTTTKKEIILSVSHHPRWPKQVL